jgi:hypothetical protein
MKIRTSETAHYYEEWSYEIDSLPDDFDDMSGDERFEWLSTNCQSATKISSDPAGVGTIDDYEIVTE